MVIESRLTEKDFINVNLVMLYNKTFIRIFTAIMVFIIVITLVSLFSPRGSFFPMVIPLAMLIILPVSAYTTAKRNFAKDQRIAEPIAYEFEEDQLNIKGESFNAQLSWDKVHKVTKIQNWVLIWQNNQIANPIPRRLFTDSQLAEVKTILERKRIKNNL